MDINQAIAHCQEVAGRDESACGAQHLQLAEWLHELVLARETIAQLKDDAEQASERFRVAQTHAVQWRDRAVMAEAHLNQWQGLLPAPSQQQTNQEPA